MTPIINSPLISIIVAVFNGVGTLQECIDSIARQTYGKIELIIIDGASSDGTVDLLKANDEYISYWISEPDNGICAAWNKGLDQATGEWICFLGADDFFWEHTSLEQMAKALQNPPPEVRIVYSQIMLVTREKIEIFPIGEPWETVKGFFRQGACLPHQGTMHKRSLFEQVGKFNESFRICGDYELLLRELKQADALFVPDLIVVGMRQGGISSNPTHSFTVLQEIRRAQKMHGLNFPSCYWLRSIIKATIRFFLWNILGVKATKRVLDFGRLMKGEQPYWTKC